MKLTVLTTDDKIAEIRRLYFAATRESIAADIARAVQLLKSMSTEEERERAAVFMDGLAQMRSDWARSESSRKPGGVSPGSRGPRRTAAHQKGSSQGRGRRK